MSTKKKLIERFKRQPKDFSWDELVRLLNIFGFLLDDKGKTSGSRTQFIKGNDAHTVHKPHPGNNLKRYALKQILDFLTKKGLLNENEREDYNTNNIKQEDNG